MPEPIETSSDAWSPAQPETLARPTWWPAALAFAVTLVGWGLITSAIVLVVGLAVFAVSIAGWIGEIRDERT